MLDWLKTLLDLTFYLEDTGLDLRFIDKICCNHVGETAIVNPFYCGTSFSIWAISSLILNGFAFKQFMVEFKKPCMRILFLLLGILQLLPFMWFIYCINALLGCSKIQSPKKDLRKSIVKMMFYYALFEGAGQMSIQMYMVMQKEQKKLGIGHLTFSECRVYNSSSSDTTTNTTSSPISNIPIIGELLQDGANQVHLQPMIDNLLYISIFSSLMSVCFCIIKGVAQRMDKGFLWKIGYSLITILAVGARVYLKSTLGTYWFTTAWGNFNIWWLTPIIACNIASMIYACTQCTSHTPRLSCLETIKRILAGYCDFLSKDGLPTSVSYFVCSLAFTVYYWPNIHLQIALFLNTTVLVVNMISACCCVKEPIFYDIITANREEFEQVEQQI